MSTFSLLWDGSDIFHRTFDTTPIPLLGCLSALNVCHKVCLEWHLLKHIWGTHP